MEMQIMLTFKEFIVEGNPLSRLSSNIKSGRHFAILSAQRSGLSKQENERRHAGLKKKLTAQGYGHKEVEGHWEGGKEKSIMVNAKKTGATSGAKLRYDMNRHGKAYGQDSVFHHNGTEGKLNGTNRSGYPGKGKSVSVGKVAYNKPDSPFQTEMRPSKKKAKARFTTV